VGLKQAPAFCQSGVVCRQQSHHCGIETQLFHRVGHLRGSSNRTIVGLKLRGQGLDARVGQRSNRTIVGLKPTKDPNKRERNLSSNRTIVGLKLAVR